MGPWLAGLLGGTVWTLCGLCRLRRFVRRSRLVPDWMTGEAALISQNLGNRREFDVRQSDEVAMPCLIGIRRPMVLLPTRQLAELHRDELKAILAHEAAHVRGRDIVWNAALHGLSLVFWFHPLMWRVRAAHASVCDAVADTVDAQYLGGAPAYGRILARLAVRMHGPAPAAALAMTRTSDVRRRIEAIQRNLFPHRLERRVVMVATTVMMLASVTLGGVGFRPAQGRAGDHPPANGDVSADVTSMRRGEGSPRAASQEVRFLAQVNDSDEAPRDEPKSGLDLYSDPLPEGAVERLGTVRYRHPGLDKHVEFLRGTSTFAIGESTNDHTVGIYDARSGRMLRKIDLDGDYLSDFRTSVYGRSIVTLSCARDVDPGGARVYRTRLVVWDATTGAEIRPIEWEDAQRGRSTLLALSPDGKTAAVGNRDGEIRIWDLPWGEEQKRSRRVVVQGPVQSLEFSADGETIAVAGRHDVASWKYQAADDPLRLAGPEHGAQVVRFSPDGTFLAVGSQDSNAARLYEVASGKLVRELTGAGQHYSRAGHCFSESGDRLFVPASHNATVEVFNVANGKVVRTLDTGKTGTGDVSLSSDGRLLAGVRDVSPALRDPAG